MASLIFALDQVSKWCVVVYLEPLRSHSVEIIPGFFDFTFVENTGVAFGMFAGKGMLVSAMILVLLIFSVRFIKEIKWQFLEPNLIAGLILGGGIGNLLDRTRLGYVIDFIDWHCGTWEWPVFNLADSAICIAVGWIASRLLLTPKVESTPAQPQQNT
jgi:signal peptidase II